MARLEGRKPRTDERNADLLAIGGRLRQLRAASTHRGGRSRIGLDLPRRLGLLCRTWLNWENGTTIPGDVLLRVLVATGVRPAWLLDGSGPMFDAPDDVLARERGDAA